jgi:hypothetical protein
MKKQSDWMKGLLYAESECQRLSGLSYAEIMNHLGWLWKEGCGVDSHKFIYGLRDYVEHYRLLKEVTV